tara:strand:+ start:3350 stop:5140 length:1791 start_codon:yes stop_codon:yes gene_type:complete
MQGEIKTIVVRDSRLPGEKTDVATMVVPEGPSSVTYQSVTTADPTSVNPIFTIDIPSQMTGLQRTAYWEMTGSFVVTGTFLDLLAVTDRVALRQFPLQSMCSSLEAQVNNTTVSIGSVNQILPALLRVANPSSSGTGVQSATASTPDWTSNYEAAVGRLNSPFRPAGDMEVSDTNGPPRTVGITSITYNGVGAAATQMTVNFHVREPIILPPFGYTNAAREKAIYGVNQIQVKANMRDFNRGLSIALPAGATMTSVAMTPTQQSILAVFVTPDDRSIAVARKEAQIFRYDYNTVQSFFTTLTAGVVNDTASVSGTSNSFQLPVIPEKILIFATYSETDRQDATQSLPDAFMPITSLQVQAGTRAGLLSGATSMDLYAMSLKNGAKTPYFNYLGLPQVSSGNTGNQANGSGGPIVIDVAADLSLPDGMTPGMQAQWQFAVSQVTATNRYGRNITGPRLVVVAITGGIIENMAGDSKVIVGGVSTLDSDALRLAPRLSSIEFHKDADDAGFGGSKIGDWFKKAGETILSGVKSAADSVLHAAPQLVEAAAMAAGRNGYGGAPLGGGIVGGARLGGARLGGARHGGARLGGAQRSLLYQ